jgi:hypothetical protein
MKIAEMEAHHDAYVGSERTIRAMIENLEFPAVFSACVASFPHIVPAINFRKKRAIEPHTPALLAFATICKYAPVLFEHSAIVELFDFVKSTARIGQFNEMVLNAGGNFLGHGRYPRQPRSACRHQHGRSNESCRPIHTKLPNMAQSPK